MLKYMDYAFDLSQIVHFLENRIMKLFYTLLFLFSLSSQFTYADDAKEMLMEDCSGCHQSEMYTRQDRKVKNTKDLSRQVSICVSSTGANWFPDDQKAVIDFLNKSYYKFK